MPIALFITKCCGVGEIDGLAQYQTPQDALKGLIPYLTAPGMPRIPFVTFTGVTKRGLGNDYGHARSSRSDNYGQAFADFLVANRLGKVISSEDRVSWSGNTIKIWIWHLDWPNLNKYLGAA